MIIRGCFLLALWLGGSCALYAQNLPVLHSSFASSDSLPDWIVRSDSKNSSLAGRLLNSGTLRFKGQRLESPTFAVDPLRYYRLDVTAQSPEKILWGIVFYDSLDTLLLADVYSSIDASATLQPHTFFFQSKANARRAQLWVPASEEQEVTISQVRITPAPLKAVRMWADSVYASIPPVSFTPASDRFNRLPVTHQKLKTGQKLRVVMLGNSIINDTGNSSWELLVEERYPQCDLEVITSVRGGTGCQYYQQDNRVDTFVVQYQPDLLIIGGISHGNDTAAIHSVIRQVRTKMQPAPEILVMSGPVGQQGDPRTNADFTLIPGPEDFRTQLQAMTADAQVAYFDMKTAWGEYINASGQEYDYFLRDPVHANARGRQVLARIVATFFMPPSEDNTTR